MIAALSLLAGVLLGLLSADVPSALWLRAVGLLLITGAWVCWRHVGARCAGLLLAGMWLASLHAAHWLHRVMPGDGRILAEGRIVSIPERVGGTVRFDLETGRLEGVPAPGGSRRLRVQWPDARVAPRVGERWRLLLRLGPLEETRNFAGLDTARQAFRAGLHGAGRVVPSRMNTLLSLAPAGLHTVRARIAARIRERIADPDAAALVTALAVGVTQGMSRDQWRVFNATGTTHLVAISGLHVTLFAWLAFRLGRFAWRGTRGRAMAREPFALLLGLAAAGGYAMLAGLSVPTQRTWLMLAVYVFARLLARRVDAAQLWSLALVLVLLIDARAPLAAGFWLSFIAVGVLLAFASNAQGADAMPRWRSALRVQFLVMLALIPASLAIFGGVSVVGLAVNLVAIPVMSLVLVPIVLTGALVAWLAPGVDALVFALAARLYDVFWPCMVWCADLESLPALWRVSPAVWWYPLAVPAAVVALCTWPWPLRATAACALLPLWFAPAAAPGSAVARVSVLDAARGSALLVRTRAHAMLFDTGDAWNTRGARLVAHVLPALDAAGVRHIDRLLLPGLQADRARGAALLALERPLGELWVAADWPGNGHAVRCRDARWSWDGVSFQVVAVGPHCLMRVSVGRASLVVSGDLDAAGERALLRRTPPGWWASEVVIIGRQTSEQGSSQQWIERTAPGLAIATGGIESARSRQRVIDRWRRQGSQILDTRRDGALELELAAGGVTLRATARKSRYPFHWRRDRR